ALRAPGRVILRRAIAHDGESDVLARRRAAALVVEVVRRDDHVGGVEGQLLEAAAEREPRRDHLAEQGDERRVLRPRLPELGRTLDAHEPVRAQQGFETQGFSDRAVRTRTASPRPGRAARRPPRQTGGPGRRAARAAAPHPPPPRSAKSPSPARTGRRAYRRAPALAFAPCGASLARWRGFPARGRRRSAARTGCRAR